MRVRRENVHGVRNWDFCFFVCEDSIIYGVAVVHAMWLVAYVEHRA